MKNPKELNIDALELPEETKEKIGDEFRRIKAEAVKKERLLLERERLLLEKERLLLERERLLLEKERQTRLTTVPIAKLVLLDNLGFSVRTYNTLARAGIKNLSDITKLTKEELSSIHDCSGRVKNEIISMLHKYNLKLADE